MLIGLGTALFFGYVIYSSMGLDQFRCEVCMEFRGQTACATAAEILAKRRSIPTTVSGTVSGAFQREVICNSVYVGSGLY